MKTVEDANERSKWKVRTRVGREGEGKEGTEKC